MNNSNTNDLFSDTGPIHGMRGPVPGTMTAKRMVDRMARDRLFPAGTPVQVNKPANGWPIDRILTVQGDDSSYSIRLCSEDCEYVDEFVEGKGRNARLKKDTVFGLPWDANNHLTLEIGQAVHVYRQDGGRMWITTKDGAWSSFFDDEVDPIDSCVQVEDADLLRLADMPKHELHAKTAALDVGHPYKPESRVKPLSF